MATVLARPQGKWRYADLTSLPDDGRRYEIVEGELFEIPSPGWAHQTVLVHLFMTIHPAVEAAGGSLVLSPLYVFLQGAEPVQPDLMVLLPGGAGRPGQWGITGPPDLLVEVTIPATRGRDLLTKRALYARAGVREYWVVDPETRTVVVFALDRDAFHEAALAGRDDRVASPLLGADFTVADIFAGLDVDLKRA